MSATVLNGGAVTIEFHTMASTVVNHAGWSIDDVMFDGAMIPVELQSLSVEWHGFAITLQGGSQDRSRPNLRL